MARNRLKCGPKRVAERWFAARLEHLHPLAVIHSPPDKVPHREMISVLENTGVSISVVVNEAFYFCWTGNPEQAVGIICREALWVAFGRAGKQTFWATT